MQAALLQGSECLSWAAAALGSHVTTHDATRCHTTPPLIYCVGSSTPSLSPGCRCHQLCLSPGSLLTEEIIHLLVWYMQNKLFLAVSIYHLAWLWAW